MHMARVRVLGFPNRGVDRQELTISAPTVGKLLTELGRRFAALQPILDERRGDRPYVKVMVNGRLIDQLRGLDTPLGPDDTVGVFPPVAGG
jgi:molybdopterin synthase sulfur carrier subunit